MHRYLEPKWLNVRQIWPRALYFCPWPTGLLHQPHALCNLNRTGSSNNYTLSTAPTLLILPLVLHRSHLRLCAFFGIGL
jgi:hypothetical protein